MIFFCNLNLNFKISKLITSWSQGLLLFVLMINYTYLFLYQVIFNYRGKICQTNSSKHAVISMQVYFCHIKNNLCKLPYGDQLQNSIGQGIYFLLNVGIQYTKKCSDKLFLFCKYVYFMCMGSPEKITNMGYRKRVYMI